MGRFFVHFTSFRNSESFRINSIITLELGYVYLQFKGHRVARIELLLPLTKFNLIGSSLQQRNFYFPLNSFKPDDSRNVASADVLFSHLTTKRKTKKKHNHNAQFAQLNFYVPMCAYVVGDFREKEKKRDHFLQFFLFRTFV